MVILKKCLVLVRHINFNFKGNFVLQIKVHYVCILKRQKEHKNGFDNRKIMFLLHKTVLKVQTILNKKLYGKI